MGRVVQAAMEGCRAIRDEHEPVCEFRHGGAVGFA